VTERIYIILTESTLFFYNNRLIQKTVSVLPQHKTWETIFQINNNVTRYRLLHDIICMQVPFLILFNNIGAEPEVSTLLLLKRVIGHNPGSVRFTSEIKNL
jgi:hypothetical protein